jgi:hypothetical protein
MRSLSDVPHVFRQLSSARKRIVAIIGTVPESLHDSKRSTRRLQLRRIDSSQLFGECEMALRASKHSFLQRNFGRADMNFGEDEEPSA